MTFGEMALVVLSVSYKPGWKLALSTGDENRPYLQVYVQPPADAAQCARSGQAIEWKGGKHYLSFHMCRQEIVGACFGAIEAAEKHEMREWFKYRGVAIYDPHLDPDKLVAFAADESNRSVRS